MIIHAAAPPARKLTKSKNEDSKFLSDLFLERLRVIRSESTIGSSFFRSVPYLSERRAAAAYICSGELPHKCRD